MLSTLTSLLETAACKRSQTTELCIHWIRTMQVTRTASDAVALGSAKHRHHRLRFSECHLIRRTCAAGEFEQNCCSCCMSKFKTA